MAAKTFAQYLIDNALPHGMFITKQVDKNYLTTLLSEVATKHPGEYPDVVMHIKRLGDIMSTLEAVTMGMDEVSTPDKHKRDSIIRKYTPQIEGNTDHKAKVRAIIALQNELAELDMTGKDDAVTMVRGGLGKKAQNQLFKLRTSPGVVASTDGNVVPMVFPKSYAEGVDPLEFWLGATESRMNIATGQVNTAKPGELLKIISNILSPSVVSADDCGTKQGIVLASKDDDILGRYLADDAGPVKAGTLIDHDVQQQILKAGKASILVRSPQTCEAKGGSVCSKCMGIRNGTGKPYQIGDHAGLITAGSLGEPLTQMTLSAKHSTARAEETVKLMGESGFRQFVETPKVFNNRKVICEVYGVIERVMPAPQGGSYVKIRETRRVPDRYIVRAMPDKDMKRWWVYYATPQVHLLKNIAKGTEVWPGMELTDGVDNMQDVARLRNLGVARSMSAQGMYDVYKNTGMSMDRRHFELLSRNMNTYVKIESIPSGYGVSRGETIEYNRLRSIADKLPKERVPVAKALGHILGAGVLDVTIGTEVDAQVLEHLEKNGVKEVSIVHGLEVSAVHTPMSRVVNKSSDFVAALNHRYLKDQLISAASTGKKSNIHGYNPITAYAYGAEMRSGKDGTY